MIKIVFDCLDIIFQTVFTLFPEMIRGMFGISDAIENAQVLIVAGALGVSFPIAWIVFKVYSAIKERLN